MPVTIVGIKSHFFLDFMMPTSEIEKHVPAYTSHKAVSLLLKIELSTIDKIKHKKVAMLPPIA